MATVPAVPLQDEGGGQYHHGQRHTRQHQQDDELDLRQAGGAALAHRHLKQPVAMTAAVTRGAAPLDLPCGGQRRSDPASSSLLAGVVAPQHRLAGGSSVAGLTHAVKACSAVQAASSIEAGSADAVVQVNSAEAPGEAGGTEARESVDAIQAGGAISTWLHQAVIHVGLTPRPREARQAATRQLCRKAVSVLTQAAIFTWRPGDMTGNT